MRLIKCYIENFGMYREREFSFDRGLNCFCSDNSTGKTTLTVFIKAMLYGIGDSRKQGLDENDRKKYSPWQGGLYGGTLTFETAGRTYLVERSFGAKAADDTFMLRDARSGSPVSDFTENLGEELFGIDREGFIRTVFLSEKSIAGSRSNPSMAAKLSDLVGADGDVGEYDSAVKLLEERRKFYQRRGGSGEIPRLRAQIAECNRELDDLERLGQSASLKELRLREKEKEIASLEDERAKASKRLSEINRLRERRTYEERYREMLNEADAERAKLVSLREFFGGEPPTLAEVDAARDADREGKRIRNEAIAEGGSEEYARLASFFSSGTDFTELDVTERKARNLAEDEARAKAIDEGTDERTAEMKRLFPHKVPTNAELSENLAKSKRKASGSSVILILLGLILAVGGAVAGYMIFPILYAMCALGTAILITGICLKAKKSNGGQREVKAFIREINPEYSGDDTTAALYEIANALDRYEDLKAKRDEERRKLAEEIDTGRAEVLGYIDRFPVMGATDLVQAILLIRTEYTRYYTLALAEEKNARSRVEKFKRAELLIRDGENFLKKYPTATSDPFGEIRTKINEYNNCISKVHKMESDIAAYADAHGISDGASDFDPSEENSLNIVLSDTEEKLRSARRELTLLEREYNDSMSECDRADEIKAKRDRLAQTLAKYEKNLSVIQLTEDILSQAHENMTAKYIGKTKDRFLFYQKKMSNIESEFGIDTEFAITRTDRGSARSEESYSRGTRDLYALAMRLALTDSLYDSELPFLILDDPFTSLDDANCERAKAMLRTIAKERQILYFTCSHSRAIKA